MKNIKLNLDYIDIKQEKLMQYATKVEKIHEELHAKAKDENEFLGWLELPTKYNKKEVEKIKKCAQQIQEDSDILLVIGIGGSYLGARAVIEALTPNFYNSLAKEQRKNPQILFVGNNLNPDYINDIINLIGNRDLSINVISKSGTTTEPAIAFRIFRELLENKYGLEEARKRIYVTTDKEKGALKQIANEEKYTTFVIPDNIGGRYSVLTAVGLLPIAVAGIDIDKLLEGAKFAQGKYLDINLKYNDCYKYAVIRNILYDNDKNIEILVSYEPKLHYMIEWWKQLFGESEGKEGKAIYPTGAEFTTDLHSLGQYIQEGRRNLFETVINIKEYDIDVNIHNDEDNLDELNYLVGKGLDYVNKKAMEGTIEAHVEGGVPNIVIDVDKLNEYTLGHLIYFFELACAMSGKLLGVNPFNQPGVEKYKRNMFRLLGKPGYVEKEKKEEEKINKVEAKAKNEEMEKLAETNNKEEIKEVKAKKATKSTTKSEKEEVKGKKVTKSITKSEEEKEDIKPKRTTKSSTKNKKEEVKDKKVTKPRTKSEEEKEEVKDKKVTKSITKSEEKKGEVKTKKSAKAKTKKKEKITENELEKPKRGRKKKVEE